MTEDDHANSADEDSESGEPVEVDTDPESRGGARKRLEEEADKAVSELDARLIDILSWVLDTETRGRIYVYLRKQPWTTSEEVAEGTGLYPSTVREALAELADEGVVDRRKRESEGAGNNPYEYNAIPPSELVANVVGRVQEELNTLFTMEGRDDEMAETDTEPVHIEVADADDDESDGEDETSDVDEDEEDEV